MICAAIFEQNQEVRELLRENMVRYLVKKDRELELMWFTRRTSREKLEKYAKKIHFAMISLENEAGIQAGQLLYRLNPECRICYYHSSDCDLEPLLSTRPVAFFKWEAGG